MNFNHENPSVLFGEKGPVSFSLVISGFMVFVGSSTAAGASFPHRSLLRAPRGLSAPGRTPPPSCPGALHSAGGVSKIFVDSHPKDNK